jgi:hypothetical protein
MWWNSVVKLWEYQCRSVFRCCCSHGRQKREEVGNNVVVSFDMLGRKTMTAVEEDGGKVPGNHLDGCIAHGCWLEVAGLVDPTEGRRIVS